MHLPESRGGGGGGVTDLVVVLSELGRALTPSPFLASAVLASGALLAADPASVASTLLEALADGNRVGSVAFASSTGSYEGAGRATLATSPGGYRLRGTAGFVLDADVADDLVVATHTEAGESAVVAVDTASPGLTVERMHTVDETRRLFTVAFDGVEVAEDRLLCEPGQQAEMLLDRVLALGLIAVAADAVGASERMLDTTVDYAKDRQQFGKPIGSFQAVKHHCANMAIAVESSRAAVGGAAGEVDEDPARSMVAASILASYVGPACSRACALAVLVHGGIGFTWEHDAHLYLKRVKLDEVLFGTPAWHRRRLAGRIVPSAVPA